LWDDSTVVVPAVVASRYLFYVPRDTVRLSKLGRLSSKSWKLTEFGKKISFGGVI
jgi:hypothetical protein